MLREIPAKAIHVGIIIRRKASNGPHKNAAGTSRYLLSGSIVEVSQLMCQDF